MRSGRIKYEITPEGSRSLEEWLKSPRASITNLQATMYIKVVLALIREGNASCIQKCAPSNSKLPRRGRIP